MPIHTAFIPNIQEALEALAKRNIIPSDIQRDKDNLYDLSGDYFPSVKFAMAVHNFITYFHKVDGLKSAMGNIRNIGALGNFFYGSTIQDKDTYFAAKIFLNFLNKIDLERLKEIYPETLVKQLIKPQQQFNGVIADEMQKFLTLCPDRTPSLIGMLKRMREQYAQINDEAEKTAFVKRTLVSLPQLEVTLELSQDSIQAKLDAKDEPIDEHRQSQNVANLFEKDLHDFKAELQAYLKHSDDYLADLKNSPEAILTSDELPALINLRNNLRSINVKDVHKTINHDAIYKAFKLSDKEIADLRSLLQNAEKEAKSVAALIDDSFIGGLVTITTPTHRIIYQQKLLALMNTRIERQPIQKTALTGIQQSLATDLEQLKNSLHTKVLAWKKEADEERETANNRFILVRLFSPYSRPALLTAFDNKVAALTQAITSAPTTIAECAADLDEFVKTNFSAINKIISTKQRASLIGLMNQSSNYLDRAVQAAAVSHSGTFGHTQLIIEHLENVVRPAIKPKDPQKSPMASGDVQTQEELNNANPGKKLEKSIGRIALDEKLEAIAAQWKKGVQPGRIQAHEPLPKRQMTRRRT
ncbi:MAG: hypothetical protein ACYCQI_14020 [Gammaproteobacteria bacterium]